MPLADTVSDRMPYRLERVLFDDFASKKLAMPFANVLVSKLIVQ